MPSLSIAVHMVRSRSYNVSSFECVPSLKITYSISFYRIALTNFVCSSPHARQYNVTLVFACACDGKTVPVLYRTDDDVDVMLAVSSSS